MKKNMKFSFLLVGFLLFLVNGDNYAAAPVLVDLAEDLNIDIQQAVFSVTSYMFFFGLFTLFIGPLSDRFGKTRVIKIAALGTALFSILGAYANDLVSLIWLRSFNGLFAAGIMPVSIALVGQSAEPANRQNSIGKMMGMMFLGGATATLIGGLLAYLGSWRVVYGAYGMAELVITFILFKTLPSDPKSEISGSIWDNYCVALKSKDLVKIIFMMFFLGFAVLGSFAFSGKLVESTTGMNLLFVGLILSTYGIGTLLGGRISGTLQRKTGNLFFFISGITGSIALALIYFIPDIYSFIPAFFLFGLSFVLLQSAFVTQAQMTNPAISGTIMSLASFMMVSSAAIGTFINGFIADQINLQTIYLIASFSLLFISLLGPFVLTSKLKSA